MSRSSENRQRREKRQRESKNFLKRALITWCVGMRCDSQCGLFDCEIALLNFILVTLFVLFSLRHSSIFAIFC